MEASISASQGAMRSLPRKLESLLSGSKHKLREVEKKKLRVLQADLQEIIDKYLIEPSEVAFPASTANSWMKDVRDLSYDIDDFIYELAHVVGGGARISVVQNPPGFKISLFPKKLRRRRWVTDEISRLRTRVKEAIRLHKECLGNCKWRPIITGQPPPSSCGRLVGLDSSIQQLCNLLANDGQPGHMVVSIVGAGGVGKTTLAREVYRRLGGQFQCLAFVRTSPKADMKGLLASLLSQVRRCRHVPDDALDVHKLVVNINEHLQHKTYLIVIEDLWALSTWDLVNRALPKGNSCSRILTTTEVDVIAQTCCADNSKFIPAQKEDISKYITSEKEDKLKYMPSNEKNIPMYMRKQIENNSKYIIKKEQLSEDESRELFSKRAFGKQAECPPGIKDVSGEIIKRSGGLPLEISILAGLLAHHPASSIEQWNYINNSLSSDLTTRTSLENISHVLNIGYDNLPHHLKACMLYLCLYEEDCIIWKDDLVKQWIAEGFISVVKGEDEEEVAHSYFDELINRGLIQPVDTNFSDEILSCRVHHMVLHFIRDKSMEENFCIVIDHSQTAISRADKVRRLAFHLGDVEHATPPGPENMILSKVRSVSFIGFHKCMPSVGKFRFLQVLNLKLLAYPDNMMTHNLTRPDDPSGNLTGSDDLTENLSEPRCVSYNLTEISELLRLRYFYLDACHMRVALPTQMRQLKYLVAWEIDAEVAVVPSDIVDIPNLLYLRIPSEAHLPTGIGRMTSLRTLGVLDLSKNSTEDVMSLSGLTNLQDLRLTCCTLQPDNLEKNLECLGRVIRKLSNLKCVTLVPAVLCHLNTQHDDGATSMSTSWNSFDDIVPLLPALLQKLEFSWRCCLFSSLPEWTRKLTKLCILKIAVRKVSKEDVVILKCLPSLTALSLFISTAPALRIIFDNEGFSVLKYFKFVCAAPCLEFLDGAMPNVRKLKLGFNANTMERYTLDATGFKRLTGLNEISIKIGGTGANEGDRKSAQSLLTGSIIMHPCTNIIINLQWVDWDFCSDDKKHIETRKEIQGQTSEKQNVTAVESLDEHEIQERSLDEDGTEQADTRTYSAPESTFHLQNTDQKLSTVEKRTDGVAEKHKVDSDGYGEIDKTPRATKKRGMEVVTGAMGSLLPKLGQLLMEEYKLPKGAKMDIGFLQREMRSMQAALNKVAWDQLDKQVKIWADDVRELSYDMEDVVDNFMVSVEGSDPAPDSNILKVQIEKMSNLFTKVKARHEIAEAIKEIKDRAQEVALLRERYKVDDVFANQASKNNVDPRLLALYKNQKDLIGIQGPRQDLTMRLTGGNGGVSKQNLEIVSICGIGGLGKTTLAKVVYDRLQTQFDRCAFVSVGRNPEVKKVLKDILLDLFLLIDKKLALPGLSEEEKTLLKLDKNEDRGDLATLDEKQLIDKLLRLLENRRYFIVIDDVWDLEDWKIIASAMVNNNHGSRIIITTRIIKVAAEASHVYKLEPLSRDSSEELFYLRLFGGKEKCTNDQPAEIINKLIHKCGGVPLAIITIASLLVGKPLEVWPKVYTSIGFGDGVNTDVESTRNVLSFSYYDLPCYLRPCLLHLSIYPEDSLIMKDSLIWKWIAEGFIREEEGAGLFETGEGYFSDLVNRSLIQPVEDEDDFVVCGCRVHDMVLDMICFLSKQQNFATIQDSNGKCSSSQKDIHRLAVQSRVEGQEDPLAKMSMLKVRSCYATMCNLSVMPSLSRFQVLRVLAMENCSFETDRPYHLEHLRRLTHLRYLSFENTPVSELPEEIGYLKFLQTLDLRDTKIKELPQSIGLLRKLKRLRADGKNVCIRLPNWIGNLTSLEELYLRINTRDLEESSIFQLGKLTELRVLICCFSTGEDLNQQSKKTFFESICNLRKIQVLRLPGLWWWSKLDEDAWNSYEPPRQLRELYIWSTFTRLPAWINSTTAPNLSTLHVQRGKMEEQDVVALGRMTELRVLGDGVRSASMPAGMEFPDGAFPKLRECWINAPFRFLQGSMLDLESITFFVVVRDSKDAFTGFDFIGSLGNLPSLRNVIAWIYCSGASGKDVEEVHAAVRQAIKAHPNCPTLGIIM